MEGGAVLIEAAERAIDRTLPTPSQAAWEGVVDL